MNNFGLPTEKIWVKGYDLGRFHVDVTNDSYGFGVRRFGGWLEIDLGKFALDIRYSK